MTTNESGKWSDFQLDINDGVVFRRRLLENRERDTRFEPEVIGWPKTSEYVYRRAYDDPLDDTPDLLGDGPWYKGSRDWALADVDNIYDIGFVGNLVDVFLPRKYLAAYNGMEDTFID